MSTIVLRCDVGELDVSSMVLRLPIRGNWVGLLGIGAAEKPTTETTATIIVTREDGTQDLFVGTVRATENVEGTEDLSVTVVGGADGLVDPAIPPVHHASGDATIPAGLVFAGICNAAGETMAAGVEDALDAFPLPRWTRVAGPAGIALDLLAWALELAWRVLPDGTVWMGAETWPEPDNATLDRGYFDHAAPTDSALVYSTDGCPFFPGTTIYGARAIEVCYHVDSNEGDAARWLCEVRHAGPGDAAYAPDLTIYRAPYAGTVRKQSDAGTLDITCDDARISDPNSGLLAIPARTSWPGCKMTVPEGTRVRVHFESADPRGAYAAASIDQDPSADKAFALLDDDVHCGTLTGVTGMAPGDAIMFTWTPAKTGVAEPPSKAPVISGFVFGPGHKYAKGVPNA